MRLESIRLLICSRMRRGSCVVVVFAALACRAGGEPEPSKSERAAPDPVVEHVEVAPDRAPTAEPAARPEPTPEPPARELDWSVPPCPLTYHYHANLGTGEANMVVEFDVVMSAHEGGVALHHGEISMRQTMGDEVFSEGKMAEAGVLADVHLERGDGVWVEVDGPTKLWSANDSAPGLMFMWPALPRQKHEGATSVWTVEGNHDNPAVARTEAARGSLELPDDWEPPEWEPQEKGTPTVTLEAWEPEGSARKAILVVDEAPQTVPIPDEDGSVTMRQRGRYEVLDSGRLLYADVEIVLEMGSTKAVQAAELRITQGCDE